MNFWDLPNSKRLFYMLGSARLVTIACGIAILLALKRQVRRTGRTGSPHTGIARTKMEREGNQLTLALLCMRGCVC